VSAAQPAPQRQEDAQALHAIMRFADQCKEPCGQDPESAAAIRNGKFATIAQIAAQGLGLMRGPAFAEYAPQRQEDAVEPTQAQAALALLKRIRYHAERHSLPREWLTEADEVLGTWGDTAPAQPAPQRQEDAK
jgi:hypothetical protein